MATHHAMPNLTQGETMTRGVIIRPAPRSEFVGKGQKFTQSAGFSACSCANQPARRRARDRSDRTAREHIAKRTARASADGRVRLLARQARTGSEARHQGGDGRKFQRSGNDVLHGKFLIFRLCSGDADLKSPPARLTTRFTRRYGRYEAREMAFRL
jgi:hypothetical protein